MRDRLMRMAEAHAHTSGGHLYEWERKIRLLCDFEGVRKNMPTSAGFPLDVPTFNSGLPVEVTMDRIDVGCQSVIRSLVSAGLQ